MSTELTVAGDHLRNLATGFGLADFLVGAARVERRRHSAWVAGATGLADDARLLFS
jgi:hypothetical protein